MKVLLVRSSWWNPASLIIAWITRSPFSHAALLDDDLRVIEANMMKGHVVMEDTLAKHYGSRKVAIFDYNGDPVVALHWAKCMIGKRYDWAGVLGYLWASNAAKKFYCFEFVVNALCKGKDFDMPVKNRFTADDVLQYCIPVWTFEGKAKDFKC